ncbi:unnamed protein product [Echinostoma caproni]|uniref:Vacuolar sorting protein 39/Transforming growth factor beta receptor-associated zinc finger domain-containing protein n=1 Tax=Echinostoma caproni TaxID=27848 RepID=A0A3P8ID69_9TREM|nr:unnamed protein product [Echinostoma caproni]
MIVPIFKKGCRNDCGNYRPISFIHGHDGDVVQRPFTLEAPAELNVERTTFFYQETLLTQLVFLRNAAQTEMIASRTDLVRTTGRQFLVMPGARCRTCRRRIGNSAFARYPTTGELEHYGCCREFVTKR